jgi:predicted acetyltransferase
VSVVLTPFTAERRLVAERLWQLYKHDMSEFVCSLPNQDGEFKSGRLPGYFDDGDAAGYFIVEDDQIVGFATVFHLRSSVRAMGDFFVVRSARRRRVGEAAAAQLLSIYSGSWTITFQTANTSAGRFWRRFVTQVVGEAWSEESLPVRNRPDVPPDIWLRFSLPKQAAR